MGCRCSTGTDDDEVVLCCLTCLSDGGLQTVSCEGEVIGGVGRSCSSDFDDVVGGVVIESESVVCVDGNEFGTGHGEQFSFLELFDSACAGAATLRFSRYSGVSGLVTKEAEEVEHTHHGLQNRENSEDAKDYSGFCCRLQGTIFVNYLYVSILITCR